MALLPQSRALPRWLMWLLISSIALLIGCAIAGAIGTWLLMRSDRDLLGTTLDDELTTEHIEQLTAMTLPPSATGVHSYYSQFQDYVAYVRFEIDPADYDALVGSSPFAAPLTIDTTCPIGAIDRPWWQADQATRCAWATRSVGSGGETLAIDQSEPQRYIVYWYGFST